MPNPMPEMLAYARFQRAVNEVAVAEVGVEDALLHGSDREVAEARALVNQAMERLALATGRALAERIAAIRAGRVQSTPMLGQVGGDGHDALEPDEVVPEVVEADDGYDQAEVGDPDADMAEAEAAAAEQPPRLEHRSINMDPVAVCGVAMSESDPAGERCPDCEAGLMKRLGTITHSSPSFGISSDTFRSR